jgi:hypothetical protein
MGKVGEINKTVPVTLSGVQSVTLTQDVAVSLSGQNDYKWIDGATEPTAPTDYARFPDLDLDIPIKVLDTTVTVKLWAFKKTA